MIENILSSFLGEIRGHSEDKNQIRFDCPECSSRKGLDNGDGKGKLEVNYGLGVYNCWVCGESHNTKGKLEKLIKKYGNNKIFELLKEFDFLGNGVKLSNEVLPEIQGLIKFSDHKRISKEEYSFKQKALKYLRSRGIDDDMIKEYNLGFTITDETFKNRVIIPSYDMFGNLNYYIGRSIWNGMKPKYLLPSLDKNSIIFNEDRLDWNCDIYLVEGVLDHMVIPNSIPLLGKVMSDYIYNLLYKHTKANIFIILDNDAYINSDIIYKKLNNGCLSGRVFNIIPKTDDDIFDIYMKQGIDGMKKLFIDGKNN